MPETCKKESSKNRVLIKRYGGKKASACMTEMVRVLLESDNTDRVWGYEPDGIEVGKSGGLCKRKP